MNKLEIIDLKVEVGGIEIIQGVTLTFHPGQIHALMGPNGSGKSTLANAIMGHPKYKITQGKILLDGKDITHEKTNLRAKAGLILSFQYPSEITGVAIGNFLRTAVNNLREQKYSVVEFHHLLKEKMAQLKMDSSFMRRYLNEGFSGGEKKRAEILQLIMLEPRYALLDEADSGLDVDAIKTVAEGINLVRKTQQEMGIIIITHYNRILEYLHPDQVSILYQGKIIASGGYELATRIEKEGFEPVIKNGHQRRIN
ncbi:TPA: Fe-S cluster assembly ATPase SufC [Candidatus Woesearchaeota archaeon]|nr:Fe-S cluster assembly ATPase SufC [Candidatus Woesearchaeota archaeon]